MKKFKIDCSEVESVKDLAYLINSLGLTFTHVEGKNDKEFDRVKKMGIVRGAIIAPEYKVNCNICTHGFKTTQILQNVECPHCGISTFFDPNE